MDYSLKACDLCYSYAEEGKAENLVLDHINLTVTPGEYVAILGHNGSGKSTFAKHCNGILLPCGGAMYVAEMDTQDEKLIYEIRRLCGMVFQNPDNQIVATMVEEDVAFGPENLGLPYEELRARVDHALKAVGMYEYRNHAPHLLSGGQKQRIAIAGVIAMRPRTIVFDEATAMLDPIGRREVLATIRKLNRDENITMVCITHHMEEAAEADRVVVFDHGTVALDGTPKEIFAQVETLRALGLAVPQTVELLHALNQCGFSLPLDRLDPASCAEAIYSAIN